MFLNFYQSFLNLPYFKGKARIGGLLQNSLLKPKLSKVIYGLIMELDPLEWTQISLIKDGCVEPLTTALYSKILSPGDTYIDVGTHVGFHTLIARHFIGDSGRVIAIEPQPYNCHKILTNWQANNFDNILVYVAAVSNQNGTIALHNQSATDKARLSLCLDPVNNQSQKFQVPLVRLDNVFEENKINRVKLLKIDVEGYELEAINGLKHYSDSVENLILEVLSTPAKVTGKTSLLVENLQGLGYHLRTVEGKAWTLSDPLPESNLWASRQV